ncbi:MAG: alpha/beta hydrolase [Acidobacteriaceae bacterium]|nr:alpha/beta hydrolase [Acidobacteriaceae bacterium]
MNVRRLSLAAVCVLVVAVEPSAFGAPPQKPASADSSFAGTWEGKSDGLPQADLTITESDGKISGSVLLYFQVGTAIPLVAPHGEGNTLTFEVPHPKCQGCEEIISNDKFRMELTGANEASLWMGYDQPKKNAAPLMKLKRRNGTTSWHDPSQHQAQFIIVEYGVRVEVLDWGGAGRPVVLLAGSGNTAHVFDDFAPKLTGFCHVYGITRRGYGESSHPDTGYTQQRLADDVLEVLNALKLVKPVLAGHSMSGEELTTLGDEHSDRLSGLIYLDAGADPANFPASDPAYMALYQKLPAKTRNRPGPTASDRSSFEAFHKWRAQNRDVSFPESELRNQYDSNPDGSVGAFRTSAAIDHAVGAGALKRDYSGIRVPVLAFFALPGPPDQALNPEDRAAADAFNAATMTYINTYEKSLRTEVPWAKLIELPGANHYVFLSNEAQVLGDMRAFIAALP